MKKLILSLFAVILVLVMAACSTAASSITNETNDEATTETGETVATQAVESNSTVDVVITNNQEVHGDADDYTWDETKEVAITLDGDSISGEGVGLSIDGSTLTITAAGTYRLRGDLSNGSIIVNSLEEKPVRLILDSVRIHNESGPAIKILAADKLLIVLAHGTENVLSDGASYVIEDAETQEENATLFSMADMTISGTGSLSVTGNYEDGITSKDGLLITEGTISVTAIDDGIRGKDYLVIHDGTITVEAQGDGLKSDNDSDTTRGYIMIKNGQIAITSSGDAISAETDIMISGGTFSLSTLGENITWGETATSTKAIKAGVSVIIDGGTFSIDSTDDAINSNNTIIINNGNFTLSTGDDGMHADTALTINGGEINIVNSYEGLESALITINGGNIHIVSSDDGINVAGGTDNSGMAPGFPQGGIPGGKQPGGGRQGGGPGMDMFGGAGDYFLYINGGTIVMDAGGDGLDSNGSIEMTGGTVLVNGPTESMNGAIDYMGTFNISGGILVAAGSAGMSEAPSTSSNQNSILLNFSSFVQAGTLFHLEDAEGTHILTFSPGKPYQSIVVSSPDIQTGVTYQIFMGGSSTGGEVDGLYSGGVYSGGTNVTSLSISSTVTTIGGRSGMR